MVNCRPSVDDAVAANDGVWLDNGSGKNDRAWADFHRFVYVGMRMHYRQPPDEGQTFRNLVAQGVAANGNHECSRCARVDFSNRAYDRHLRDLMPSLCRIIIVNSDHIEPGYSQSTDDHLGMPAGANNGHADLT